MSRETREPNDLTHTLCVTLQWFVILESITWVDIYLGIVWFCV